MSITVEELITILSSLDKKAKVLVYNKISDYFYKLEIRKEEDKSILVSKEGLLHVVDRDDEVKDDRIANRYDEDFISISTD